MIYFALLLASLGVLALAIHAKRLQSDIDNLYALEEYAAKRLALLEDELL